MLMSRSVDTVIAVAAMLLIPSDTMVIDGITDVVHVVVIPLMLM